MSWHQQPGSASSSPVKPTSARKLSVEKVTDAGSQDDTENASEGESQANTSKLSRASISMDEHDVSILFSP